MYAVGSRLKLRRSGWLAAVWLVCCTACSEPGGEQEPPAAPVARGDVADLVLLNGGIYTVDGARRWVEAAAVREGVFVAVGANSEIEPLIDPATQVFDLAGHMALPGFHDAHVHPIHGGYSLLGCDLSGLTSVQAIIDTVTACAAENGGTWLEGHAFDLSLFGQDGPHKSLLDAITTERPIVLWAADGHNAWVNSAALERARITAETPDPALGVIEREADGSPSGTLRETAQELVRAALPPRTPEARAAALRAGVRHLNAWGVTSFIDASVALEDYEAYRTLDQAGELSARVVTSLTYERGYGGRDSDAFDRTLAGRKAYESGRVNHDSVKLFLDGVLEGETAALVEPYVGMNGGRGELIFQPGDLNAAVTRFDAMGLQVHMHAIGDRAVRAGLDALAAARRHNGPSDNRHHIAHLQLIHVDDIERFHDLDATANFQALWAWPDAWIMELNLPVLGEERVQGMYPIGSIVRAGGRIVGGSDWSVSSANPLEAIETAIGRQDPSAAGGPVLNESEGVDLATMLDAYTINGAWLMRQDDRVGSIEVGKRADVVVLDRNLFELPATEISDAKILVTLLDGEIVWSSNGRMAGGESVKGEPDSR